MHLKQQNNYLLNEFRKKYSNYTKFKINHLTQNQLFNFLYLQKNIKIFIISYYIYNMIECKFGIILGYLMLIYTISSIFIY